MLITFHHVPQITRLFCWWRTLGHVALGSGCSCSHPHQGAPRSTLSPALCSVRCKAFPPPDGWAVMLHCLIHVSTMSLHLSVYLSSPLSWSSFRPFLCVSYFCIVFLFSTPSCSSVASVCYTYSHSLMSFKVFSLLVLNFNTDLSFFYNFWVSFI